jgi:hypothetical protein
MPGRRAGCRWGTSRCCAPSSSMPWRWRTTRPPSSGAATPRTTVARAALLAPAQVIEFKKRETLDTWWRAGSSSSPPTRTPRMRRYADLVERVRAAEAPLGKTSLAETVARKGLFKLMAYKDEYEVARLHAETGFRRRSRPSSRATSRSITTWRRRMLAKRNDKGELVKRKFGPATIGFRCWPSSRACAARRWMCSAAPRSVAPSGRWSASTAPASSRCWPALAAGQPRAGAGNRRHSRADQGLRPRQGTQPGGRPPAMGCAAAPVARAAGQRQAA